MHVFFDLYTGSVGMATTNRLEHGRCVLTWTDLQMIGGTDQY